MPRWQRVQTEIIFGVSAESFSVKMGRAVRNFKLATYHSTNMTSGISTMTRSDTHQTRMNGGSSFLLRVQARGLPMLSLPLQVGVVSFFCLVRVLSHPITESVDFALRRWIFIASSKLVSPLWRFLVFRHRDPLLGSDRYQGTPKCAIRTSVGITIDWYGYLSILFSRMAVWKHYIILFGGFYDPGITSRFSNFSYLWS